MNCNYFGICASCTLFDKTYEEQLNYKIQREKERFSNFTNIDFDIIKSNESNFRNRAEFRIWWEKGENNKEILSYAMNDFKKNILKINSCEMVSFHIKELMPKLIDELQNDLELSFKLFAVEFLGSSTKDMLVTLIYHKKLEESWIQKAKEIEKKLNIKIIGRSKKQRLVLTNDYINETLNISNQNFFFAYEENGFTQPNTNVNVQMIEWVLENTKNSSKDLCELYCGGGNFTIPLSTKFRKVLATEISKTSIKSALRNCSLNKIESISFIRMSAEDFVQALNKVRAFNRLKDINLDDYEFDTIFMDPPRSGLDDTTRNLAKDFENIIYISCNPETLHRDLEELTKTHEIEKFALFDQFAFTNHIESGVILRKLKD
ncbi:tRNA (uracil-5-)-methyltransferase [Aliarcobacter butzleri RM4018]|uniref:tRNA/tmRNA (uracil-C(5))-methyltransferase n=1 Tax=Aliarcobacter butzleri (strain RM4018) TaxID=367737 RepID=TRMA_ALIB4|nr:tRNA (uridine(54)-C5)-methyltransferase TrmA [Aliarcobacter butzleri]A8EWU8.1 RecName: Full=tRNA/tmRNA (uracil-C(5))-methyltransferase; AltName: Full=tRNA (uracil(54)-C(5))-methyltransferase; AltName: Full=tRNA(m5U54)-methyltransferase; Short=RUMT; AltName: Full=tmRNA (uracil(341)-C(5))-methyltransferase [Aliarcobacter butzleri RM4018]ABV68421.1 tRNA (uracil-5-)-methyltransferase [Aliarcobacter butzleri RM4018]GGT82399.1 tRNA/tmRNA (uracil-C(5))-methyltransferase [Aliarcobacter butzleri]SNV3